MNEKTVFTKDDEDMIIDVDGKAQEYEDYKIIPNTQNEFLRLMILDQKSPAFGYLVEITSVETEIIDENLILKLGFEIIDSKTNDIISELYEEFTETQKSIFIRDIGNAFTNIVTKGIELSMKDAMISQE